jgi:serine/threonine protein kinase
MTADARPGTILAGRYRVERVLGQGGMGMVVSAHHLHLDVKVAIKFLLPQMLEQADVVERFAREARAAVKIKSEYVARVSDVGTLETGAPYLVMEYLEGEDLAQRLKREGPLPFMQAVEFVLQASEALAEAHALGIVHRDLKPANLFCVRRADGLLAAKVLDFGISKAGGGVDLGMTGTSVILGSPYYMAPEQMLSAKNADAQSDIWSLGVVLFELLSGYVPFQGETFPEIVLTVTGTAMPDVNAMAPDVPEGLRRVVLRCLERDRARRYSSVSQLAGALVPFGPPGRAHASADRVLRIAMASGKPPPAPLADRLVPTASAGSAREVLSTSEEGSTERPPLPIVSAGWETLVPLGSTNSRGFELPRRSLRPVWLGGLGLVFVGGMLLFLSSRPQPAELAPVPSVSAAPHPVAPSSIDPGVVPDVVAPFAALPVPELAPSAAAQPEPGQARLVPSAPAPSTRSSGVRAHQKAHIRAQSTEAAPGTKATTSRAAKPTSDTSARVDALPTASVDPENPAKKSSSSLGGRL